MALPTNSLGASGQRIMFNLLLTARHASPCATGQTLIQVETNHEHECIRRWHRDHNFLRATDRELMPYDVEAKTPSMK